MKAPAIGDRFGRLCVTGAPISRNGRYWPCKCDCGAENVMASITTLRARNASNGGCASCSRVKHGHGSSRDGTYSKFQAMRQRCLNPKHKSFPEYGGRSIKVCERWGDFANFLADMGEAPPGMTIERIDANGHYEPGNCEWATRHEQSRNTSRSIVVRVDGVTYKTLKDAAEAYGVPYSAVRRRLSNPSWSVESALKTPLGTCKKRRPTQHGTEGPS